ncbi:hypothetical protein FKW77_000314 [Venturia effusa]|uniref:Uncharacterized protein n=1 Tax=Venturia effusa TaxID=50376 RepID=A0A517LJJ7_9PEZI|nr:hypothetical protein FKW77_000314 [Venturia effusa]
MIGRALNNMFRIFPVDFSPHDYFTNFKEQNHARVATRAATRAAMVSARVAQNQAESVAKAKYNVAIETLALGVQRMHADAQIGQKIQMVIAALLVLNFLALVGVIIANTPALEEQRDRYVTPAIRGMVRCAEMVKAVLKVIIEIHVNAVLTVLDLTMPVWDTAVGVCGIVKVLIVAALNGELKVVLMKQCGMVPRQRHRAPVVKVQRYVAAKDQATNPFIGGSARAVAYQNDVLVKKAASGGAPPAKHARSTCDIKSEPEALDKTYAESEPEAYDYTPSGSENEDGNEVLDVQDYIDAAENDFDTEGEDNMEEAGVRNTADGESAEWDMCDFH